MDTPKLSRVIQTQVNHNKGQTIGDFNRIQCAVPAQRRSLIRAVVLIQSILLFNSFQKTNLNRNSHILAKGRVFRQWLHPNCQQESENRFKC